MADNSNELKNLRYIESTSHTDIIQAFGDLGCQTAHFTNGTYAYKAEMIVPTTLAGFKYVAEQNPLCPLVIAVNSDKSMESMKLQTTENQSVRAAKVAEPLAQYFSDRQVIVLYYDEKTPNALYQALHASNITKSLHKWGYGTDANAPKIEGAELFDVVYSFPLPNDIKPVCHDLTALPKEQQPITIVDLRNELINKEGVLFELPNSLQKYQSPAFISHPKPLIFSNLATDDAEAKPLVHANIVIENSDLTDKRTFSLTNK